MFVESDRNITIVLVAISLAAACTLNVAMADNPVNDKVAEAVRVVCQVDSNGQGHADAVVAMRTLNSASPNEIPMLLEGMDGANKLAVNWLRSAVVKIAGDGSSLPRDQIRKYFDDKERAHLGRLLAFDLLTEDNDALKAELVPTLVDDPSLPLRYKAIEHLIDQSKSTDEIQSIGILGVALNKARDINQVIDIAERLEEKGVPVDLQNQLGFIIQWNVVGNFDNKDEKGFDIEFGPERSLSEIDLETSYESNGASPSNWQSHNTSDSTGLVDLNDVIGKVKGVIAYAHGTFDSEVERSADIRIGCINAHKVWVNGELVMSNHIYHNGISPDKFVAQATLKKGKNDILIKVCQNEQTEPWAQDWEFQLRVCDETGKAFKAEPKNNDRSGG